MIFKKTLTKSLSFTVRDSRSLTCAAHLSVFLICLSYRGCPIRPYGDLPLEGADDMRKSCDQETFGHRLIYLRRLDPSTQFS